MAEKLEAQQSFGDKLWRVKGAFNLIKYHGPLHSLPKNKRKKNV